ncbi:MAG: hypothetical protein A2934_00380 [Candidatus Sungbacteria bacterium RIFCSPLOWO2_01_FULL_47_10]|uniref:Uncharacterized protein n=1 Tax=Candidatus Sungbacteria bacterium RIFCSPLOWO2_01_FULL_47_10 TaxID=1802276 RepID=A0A1G2KYL2_9BACT|nr:MAG: hypothetical protein A2934_00380 [Candidatus Sungbacteria bacterium RIFCSPLOWO2_01_FULL_47_10]
MLECCNLASCDTSAFSITNRGDFLYFKPFPNDASTKLIDILKMPQGSKRDQKKIDKLYTSTII